MVAGIIVFATKLKNCIPSIRYVKKSHIKTVTGIGVVFFACQIFYMLIVNTNEFLITNLFGPQKTTEYTYYYKLTSIISIITSLALTPIWSVVTKAMEEKNYVWVKKLYCKIKILGMLAIFFQFIIILFLQPIMDLWLGKGVISVENSSAIAFAMFGSVFIYSGALSTIVCGMSRMRLQALFYGFGAVFKFIFIYLLANVFDNWIIVVWSNVFVLLPYCIVQQIDLDIYLNKLIKN